MAGPLLDRLGRLARDRLAGTLAAGAAPEARAEAMSNSRAIGAAVAAGIAAMALRALDRGEEARAVIVAGSREAAALARDPDLAPVQSFTMPPQEGNGAN